MHQNNWSFNANFNKNTEIWEITQCAFEIDILSNSIKYPAVKCMHMLMLYTEFGEIAESNYINLIYSTQIS